MSCHIISYHIISYHIISYHIISYHIISCHIISYHIISCHIMSCHVMSCHVMSCHVISYHITPCFVIIHTGGEKTAVTGCDRVRGERVRDRGAKRKRSQTIDRRTKKSLHLNNSISTHSVLFAFCSLHRYTVLHYTHTHTHTHVLMYLCVSSQ